MTLFIKKFNKCTKKTRPYKGDRKEKSMSKRVCYNCDKNGHFIVQCHMREKKKTTIRKRSLTKAIRKTKNILRRNLMIKLMSVKNKTQVMRVLNWKVMT
jgi:hypothetical protein